MNNKYFSALKDIYNKLDKHLLEKNKNCGKCCICCLNIRNTTFSFLETSYIYENIKHEKSLTETFKSIRERRLCPYCNLSEGTCNIYHYRPMKCRLYGPFMEEMKTYLFKDCVYHNHSSIYQEENTILPFMKEFIYVQKSYEENFMNEEKNEINKILNYKADINERIKIDIDLYTKALEISFHRGAILTLIGRAYGTINDFFKAEEYYKEAIKVHPSYDFAYYLQAVNYCKEEKIEKAENSLKKVIEINRDNINANSLLIMLYITQKRYKEASEKIKYLSSFYPYIMERYPILKDINSM